MQIAKPKPYGVAVLIGRMQFFHNGHAQLLRAALDSAARVVVVLGSSFQARSAKNPFTADERAQMIARTLPTAELRRVAFVPVRDYYDDARWDAAVRRAVAGIAEEGSRVALISHQKDASGYYLSHFPEWPAVPVEPHWAVDATRLRKALFEAEPGGVAGALASLRGAAPDEVLQYVDEWASRNEADWTRCGTEHKALIRYRERWPGPSYNTADALVQAGDSVLLVRRASVFGRGLWAIPGGFAEEGESFVETAIRELREETHIAVPQGELEQALRGTARFDHPARSPRGRLISYAHHFVLPGSTPPAVAALDENEVLEVKWAAIRDLPAMESEIFEDHFMIFDRFLGLVP